MATPNLDVVGIGNAIVDVLVPSTDTFLSNHELKKGIMALVDENRADALYRAMGSGVEASGGSCGNTMAGIASLGGKGAYIGKVRDDQLGKVFAHDMRAIGVRFDTAPLTKGPATARCLILVTPDAQRTMNTYLGACVELGPEDIDPALIQSAQVTYLEGYLFDPPRAKEAFRKAAKIAHDAGRKVSLSLSDPFCVDRYRDEFRDLVANHVDILFANESEICSLYEVNDFEDAVNRVRGNADIAVLTRSEQGSVVVTRDREHRIPVHKADSVVDSTGAGDLYAAGFLYGLTNGKDLVTSGKLGSLAAAEVISHYGARPETPLKDLAKKAGLL
ncbi:MAG TPA: adenosine kinase [Stellaceae bacterium]|jgi:sugar/nucleoside kinase (ribokinase family)